jgi:hypothetical protein
MRPIKFRWKSIEIWEWLYWDLWRRQQNGQGTIYTFITHNWGRIERVDPETVWQFTWLLDKNGKEIYENCIIDDTYEVIFIFPWYVLKNIYNGDITNFQNYEWQIEITREYKEL